MKIILSYTLPFVLLLGLVTVQAAGNPQVKMQTSEGDVIIELYPDKAPVSVENFLRYVNDGAYDDTVFHRVIKGFMNQGGAFTSRYNVKKLVWYEIAQDVNAAIAREKQIKGGSRKKKIALVDQMNPDWRDLYDEL